MGIFHFTRAVFYYVKTKSVSGVEGVCKTSPYDTVSVKYPQSCYTYTSG